ncbi:MAG: hypothetical protein WBM50_26190 [Acidimicrobiales bacterium]
MIELGRLKRWLAVLLGLSGLLVGLLVLRQAADAILRAATGADPASIFNEPPAPPSELLEVLDWLPDTPRDGRQMEPATRRTITDAYARALSALDRSGRGDVDAPLREYLGGSALGAALEAAGDERTIESSTFHLRQQLTLEFYSDDGAVVAVSAPGVEIVRVVGDRAATPSRVVWSDEAWRFVMILEDGNWRLHQLEIVAVDDHPPAAGGARLDQQLDGVNSVTVNDLDPTWRSYDPAVGAVELDHVLALGLDTVRVFIAGPEAEPVDTGAITSFLDLAAERDISVVPVLFDGSADHGVGNWRLDRDYLDHVVGNLAGHPAIVMWDLKNEPDLDDDRSGGARIVDAWLDRIGSEVRRIDPSTPVTVGWSSPDHARRGLRVVDVVSFHHFGDADSLEVAIGETEAAIGDRQLVVSEFGRPAWVGFIRGNQPAAQSEAVGELVEVIEADDLAGSMVWVLRDPDRAIEPGLVAARASVSYGLFEADGTERPVAATIRTGGDQVADPGLTELIRSGLTLTTLLAISIVAAALAVVWRRRLRLIET